MEMNGRAQQPPSLERTFFSPLLAQGEHLYVSAPRAKMFELVGCQAAPGFVQLRAPTKSSSMATSWDFFDIIIIKGVNFPLFGFRKMLLPNPYDSSRNPMIRAAPLIVRQWPRAAWQTTRT